MAVGGFVALWKVAVLVDVDVVRDGPFEVDAVVAVECHRLGRRGVPHRYFGQRVGE
jgi:hypothetical protein